MENACVCCGSIIPEGCQVCPICERFDLETKNQKKKLLSDSIKRYKKIRIWKG